MADGSDSPVKGRKSRKVEDPPPSFALLKGIASLTGVKSTFPTDLPAFAIDKYFVVHPLRPFPSLSLPSLGVHPFCPELLVRATFARFHLDERSRRLAFWRSASTNYHQPSQPTMAGGGKERQGIDRFGLSNTTVHDETTFSLAEIIFGFAIRIPFTITTEGMVSSF